MTGLRTRIRLDRTDAAHITTDATIYRDPQTGDYYAGSRVGRLARVDAGALFLSTEH